MSIPRFSVRNPLTINLLTGLAVILGVSSMLTIQKEAFPPVSFDIVTIRTTYPGAAPEVVEKFVTIKLEDELKSVDGIDELTSVSAQNISLIAAQLDPDDKKNRRKIVNDIQRAIDRVKDLPPDVLDNPVVTELDAQKFPVITVTMHGLPYGDLQKHAKRLEDDLLDLPDVGSITRLGYHDPEIWVEIDPDKAHLYHISLSSAIEALRRRNINLTGGEVQSKDGEVNIRTNGEFNSPSDIQDVIIRSNDQGKIVRVKDIANVFKTFEDNDVLYSTNSNKSINLMVVKKISGDVINMVEDIQSQVDEFSKSAPDALKISYVDDYSYFVERRLGVLINNGVQGALLILVFLFLVLAPPIAVTAAMDIPITFLITLALMKVFGVTLNLMSMFGLIMVIGLLVDDAIIMAENVFRHIEKGGDPKEAAINGGEEVVKPVTAAVLTSISAYLPLAFMSGIIGQYVRAIPIVVGIALCVSWLTTIFAIPTHAAEFTIAMKHQVKAGSRHWFDVIRNGYMKLLRRVIDGRYLVVLGISAFIIATIVFAASNMKFILFSSEGMDEFYIRGETPIGTSLLKTQELILPVEKVLSRLNTDEMENYVTEVGVSRESSGDPTTMYGTHLVQIHVYLTPAVDRKRDAFQIMDQIGKDIQSIKGFDSLKVEQVRPGPPVGKAVEAKIRGDEFKTILEMAEKLKAYLATLSGAVNIDDDHEIGRKELSVIIDREKIARAGLSYEAVAREIRNAFRGGVATTIQKSDEEVDVRVKFADEHMTSLAILDKVLIPNARQNLIPLSQIASYDFNSSVAAIKRFDRKRMVMVYCDADESVTSSVELNQKLMGYFNQIKEDYPEIDVVFAGEQERTQESLVSLLLAFIAAMMAIFCIISIQFRSLIQPPVVMMTIPLGLVGVIWALFLHGKPFSFMSVMGFIGLSGVVVNDSIVMIDFMNKLRRKGIDRRDSILEACHSRFRAIVMASITTVAGTMPMAYGWGGDDPFIRPMALAFTWGIAFASFITLFAIPCFYAIVDDISSKILRHATVKVEDSAIYG